LFYDILTVGFRGGITTRVYERLLRRLHPKMDEADLLILIAPHRISLIPQRLPGASKFGLNARLGLAVYFVLLLAEPFWLIYAFWVLFSRFNPTDFTVWAALTLSLLFVVLGSTVLAYPFGRRRAPDDEELSST
jgi:hypothetical protein